MNSIIYTGATGAGHTLAARSLEEALTDAGEDVIIIDAFKEGGTIIDKTVTKGYEKLVESWPKLYKKLYNTFDNESVATEVILKEASRILKKKFLFDIDLLKPDLIISTHPIVTNILGRLKDEGRFDIPILALVTDFVIHDVYIRDSIDAYIVSNDYTKETMLEKGVDASVIYTYGIPVRKEFRDVSHREDERKRLSILLMAGSLGSKQLRKAFMALLDSDSAFNLHIVCGQNRQIKKELERIAQNTDFSDKNVVVSGYVNNISELMDQSDLIITKPGGLTSSEAICKQVPIIVAYTYPGVEEYNRDYLVANGLALNLGSIEELTPLIERLERDPQILRDIRKNMSEAASSYSLEKTVSLCKELAKPHIDNSAGL